MQLKEVKTYKELGAYLAEKTALADDTMSKHNKFMTRKIMWEVWMTCCIRNYGKNLTKEKKWLLINKIGKDF